MDDSEMIELFFRRSEQAIAALADKYGPLCTRTARNILGSAQDAEECVSDAYLAVWNAIPPQCPEHLLSYLCRVVRNLALKKRRDQTAQKRNSSYDGALDELEGCLAGPETAETALEARALTEALERFLDGLKREDRILFVRRYWFGDSLEDLAEQSGLRRHTVTVRLSRIRQKLRQYLQKEGFDL